MRPIEPFQFRCREIIADRVRKNEIAVGQSLHQRTGSEPVGAVIGEVSLADRIKPRDRRHQVVIHPQAAHRVVNRRIDSHWNFVRILARNPFVHIEQISIPLTDTLFAETFDGVGKVEVNAETAFPDALAFVAYSLCIARCHITRYQIPEAGILPL